MKTSLEKTNGLGRKLNIEVPVDRVSSTFDRVYKGLQKNANIKGFRKGKAPMTMIRSMYADRVKADVLEDLISQAYSHALDEHALDPVSQPRVNFDQQLEESKPFEFTAEFEIRPEIKLQKITGLKIEKEKLEAGEEKVESILTQIRESKAKLVPVLETRATQPSDTVDIDFVGTVDGQPLEGGSMNAYKLQLGSNSFIPGFEDGLIGMNVGDTRELNLTFPADYNHKEIAGKPVHFKVKLNSILKKDLPELTEDFIKELGPYESVDQLKDIIRKDVFEQESKRINEDLKTRVLKALTKENPVEVPLSLLEKQKQFLISDVEKRMKEQGMGQQEFEDYKMKWDKDFSETASFMIQTSFIVETIAVENKLAATNEEFNKRLETYALQSRIEIDKIRDFYQNNHDRKHQFKYQITEEKVVAFLIDNAEVKEVPRNALEK